MMFVQCCLSGVLLGVLLDLSAAGHTSVAFLLLSTCYVKSIGVAILNADAAYGLQTRGWWNTSAAKTVKTED